jgi:hypothetical protein
VPALGEVPHHPRGVARRLGGRHREFGTLAPGTSPSREDGRPPHPSWPRGGLTSACRASGVAREAVPGDGTRRDAGARSAAPRQ